MLLSALSALSRPGRRPAGANPARRRGFRPRLEALEDRLVPTHWTVSSPADNINQPNTLRYAVAQAKSGDTIDIQTAQTIVLTHGELVLAHDLTIDFAGFSAGHQATISGDFLSRVFEVAPAAHVNLFDLNLIDGNGVANNPNGTQAADHNGGAILNLGALALTGCTLSDNGKSLDAFGLPKLSADRGGGIQNGFFNVSHVADLTLTGSDLHGNFALSTGGGVSNLGSAAVLGGSSLHDNNAELGGGLFNDGGIMLVADSALHDNTAFSGAGIWSTGPNARLFVLACTLTSNVASQLGGGITLAGGTLLAIDDTFSDNHAQFGSGGGIAATGDALMVVLHCTFDSNGAAQSGGAIFNSGGATATVETSTLSNNTAASGGGIYNDSFAVLNLGFSLLQTNTPDNLDNQGTYNDLGGNTFI
jgi:predicted outer membrane repeat protein